MGFAIRPSPYALDGKGSHVAPLYWLAPSGGLCHSRKYVIFCLGWYGLVKGELVERSDWMNVVGQVIFFKFILCNNMYLII